MGVCLFTFLGLTLLYDKIASISFTKAKVPSCYFVKCDKVAKTLRNNCEYRRLKHACIYTTQCKIIKSFVNFYWKNPCHLFQVFCIRNIVFIFYHHFIIFPFSLDFPFPSYFTFIHLHCSANRIFRKNLSQFTLVSRVLLCDSHLLSKCLLCFAQKSRSSNYSLNCLQRSDFQAHNYLN